MFSRLLVPDTFNYMIVGYLVITIMALGYIMSLFLRWRKAAKEYLTIKEKNH